MSARESTAAKIRESRQRAADHLIPVVRTKQSDGVAFDPFSFQKDGSASAEVDVGRCEVL